MAAYGATAIAIAKRTRMIQKRFDGRVTRARGRLDERTPVMRYGSPRKGRANTGDNGPSRACIQKGGGTDEASTRFPRGSGGPDGGHRVFGAQRGAGSGAFRVSSGGHRRGGQRRQEADGPRQCGPGGKV